MNKTLVLFTSSYPYEGGEQFIETEIDYLASAFQKIIIVPSKKNDILKEVPRNVIVDDFIANLNKNYFNRIKALFSREFLKYLSFNIKQNKYWAINVYYTIQYRKWIKNFIKKYDLKETLFYTYWFNGATTALFFEKQNNPMMKYVTRVHGGDLYESVHGFSFFPSRNDVLKNINKVFSVSKYGKEHILNKYKFDKNKIQIARLGIKPHGLLSRRSNDGVFRIVSCSSLIKVKRVHLIVEALSKINKNIKIEWTHIGNGYLMSDIKKFAEKKLNDNIKYNFLGFIENKKIYEFYANNPVDLFINVSSSEGVPVSIMEAQSFGIPCIATDVGGNNEIVNEKNGFLIKANPRPEDISKIIEYLFNNKDVLLNKSKLSFENWNKYYNADKNYYKFTKTLLGLISNDNVK